MATELKSELKRCKCCHCNKRESDFDIKKDGIPKLTCRKCLLTAKSRFQAKPSLAIYKDIKKIRMEIMTEIHANDEPTTLTNILTNIKRLTNQSFQNLISADVSLPNDKNDITTSTSTLNCETAPSPFQTLDPQA